jgi:pimeloyl-ACP methyl ester carboxylesterase
VFLAGYGNTAHVFDGFAPQFRDRFRVVAITRRGFGTSSLASSGYDDATLAMDVLAVLDSLALERPVIVAHSFGGAEANALATLRPQRVRAVVYLDSGFDFAELYADRAWMTTRIPRPPLSSNEVLSPSAATRYAALMTGPGYPEAEVRANDAWVARLSASPAFHADSLQTWLVRGTSPVRWASIHVPALAIYGVPGSVEEKYPWTAGVNTALHASAERRFNVERPLLARQRARFRAEVPHGVVMEVAGGRHYVFLTHPRQVARAIRDFVK